MPPDRHPRPGTGGGTEGHAGLGLPGSESRAGAGAAQSPAPSAARSVPPPPRLMATRVLSMSARLGAVQQPEEPVFAQLKPVLGAREAPIFPGEDMKQQQPPQPPPQQQQQHPGGGGGGGATLPAEEMVQVGEGG